MVKYVLSLCCVFALTAQAAETKRPRSKTPAPLPDPIVEEAYDKPKPVAAKARPFVFNVKGGLLTSSPDDQVRDKWDHDTMNSYLLNFGFYYQFQRAWRHFKFYSGADFAYMVSEEEIAGAGPSSFLTSTLMQLFLTGGLNYMPAWLGGDWGFGFFTAFEVWGEKETKLQAGGYSASVLKGDTQTDDFMMPINIAVGISTFYDLGAGWKPFLGLDKRTAGGGSAVTFGVNYEF